MNFRHIIAILSTLKLELAIKGGQSSLDKMTKETRIYKVPKGIAMTTMEKVYQDIKTTHKGCHIPSTSVSGSYHQVQPQVINTSPRSKGFKPWDGAIGRVLVHQVTYLAVTGMTPKPGEDVSHLCHNSKCCNTEHLVIEPHAINMSRQRCPGTITVEYSCPHKKCNKLHTVEKQVCQHSPPCLVTSKY